MIGYNVEKINELMETMRDNLKKVADTLNTAWPTLSNAMRKEWVGPDEISGEEVLAKVSHTAFDNCKIVIQNVVNTMKELGTNWKEWQKGHGIVEEGGTLTGTNADMSALNFEEINVENVADLTGVTVTQATYAIGTQMGLQSDSAASNVTTAVNDYITTAKDKINELYSSIQSNISFAGEQQSQSMDKYIEKAKEGIAYLFDTSHSKVKEKLSEAITAYKTTEESYASQVNNASTGLN